MTRELVPGDVVEVELTVTDVHGARFTGRYGDTTIALPQDAIVAQIPAREVLRVGTPVMTRLTGSKGLIVHVAGEFAWVSFSWGGQGILPVRDLEFDYSAKEGLRHG